MLNIITLRKQQLRVCEVLNMYYYRILERVKDKHVQRRFSRQVLLRN